MPEQVNAAKNLKTVFSVSFLQAGKKRELTECQSTVDHSILVQGQAQRARGSSSRLYGFSKNVVQPRHILP